jgi:hypothetical protein
MCTINGFCLNSTIKMANNLIPDLLLLGPAAAVAVAIDPAAAEADGGDCSGGRGGRNMIGRTLGSGGWKGTLS